MRSAMDPLVSLPWPCSTVATCALIAASSGLMLGPPPLCDGTWMPGNIDSAWKGGEVVRARGRWLLRELRHENGP